MQCYPDMDDVEGCRLLIKCDGGPGRDYVKYLAEARADGLYHYPGLSNGTLFQEYDQAFAYIKQMMDKNRESIFKKGTVLKRKRQK